MDGRGLAGMAVLLRTQVGAEATAGTVADRVVDAVSAPADDAAQLFTFSSSTSKISVESGPMSRPAPRLP